jgi:hypothetical protein
VSDATVSALHAVPELSPEQVAAPVVTPDLVQKKVAAAKTPADFAALIAANPTQIDAYVDAAQKQHGNSFVTKALALAAQASHPTAVAAEVAAAGPQAASAAKPETATAERDPNEAAKIKALTEKWGVRPRRFSGLVDGGNATEALYRSIAPQAVAFINAKAAERKLKMRITLAELTTNFIAEGGYYVLNDNMTDGIDGFQHLGIDTFIDRIAALRPWLHPSIAESRLQPQKAVNEKGETVTSITNLSIIQAIYASAAMMGWNKSVVEGDLGKAGKSMNEVTDTEQYYLDTVYFNAGPGFGKKLLANQGLAATHRKWEKTDDLKHSTNAQFNASWRTASFELMRDSTLQKDNFRPTSPANADASTKDLATASAATTQRIAELERLAVIDNQTLQLAQQIAAVDPVSAATAKEFQEYLKLGEVELLKQRELLAAMNGLPKAPGAIQ